MVAHVLLARVHPRLVVPRGQAPFGERAVHEPTATLAVEHRLVQLGQVPALQRLAQEGLDGGGVGRVIGQVVALLRVLWQVVEHAHIVLGIDEFPRATTNHHQGRFAALGHVLAKRLVGARFAPELRHE